jgi:hypothetical protein
VHPLSRKFKRGDAPDSGVCAGDQRVLHDGIPGSCGSFSAGTGCGAFVQGIKDLFVVKPPRFYATKLDLSLAKHARRNS